MNIDLHTHTSMSDGSLSPLELIERAEQASIDMLSITDHDNITAYDDIKKIKSTKLTLIPGIECSSEWKKIGIHIVGLNIQLDCDAMRTAVNTQSRARLLRAQGIAEQLDKLGVENSWEGVQEIAAGSMIGRPHFAQLLIKQGVVKDFKQAFKKYLGAGKAGDIKRHWAPYPQIIEWIRDANGIAVLAHPNKYNLTRTKLVKLLNDFNAAGGESMEVISGSQTDDVTRFLSKLCQQKNMLASCGSDFHHPGQAWCELGKLPPLPRDCRAIWKNWC
jgi:3',5'-nucleoside bisphosphate phosphatase